jgi:hypothetical protein
VWDYVVYDATNLRFPATPGTYDNGAETITVAAAS